MRRKGLMGSALVLALVTPPCAYGAERDIRQSWGKPGVSLEDYLADSARCAKQGYYLDISQTDSVKALISASTQIEQLNGPAFDSADASTRSNQIARLVESARPSERLDAISALLSGAVEGCLMSANYRRFYLTRAQRRAVSRLRVGTLERRRYLYGLASNGDVLAAQANPPSSDRR